MPGQTFASKCPTVRTDDLTNTRGVDGEAGIGGAMTCDGFQIVFLVQIKNSKTAFIFFIG